MSFGSFLKKAFNPFTPMTTAMNINRQIKAGGLKGLMNPMAPITNTIQGFKDTANSTNDPNPYSLGRDVVTGLGKQGVKGMFNPLSSLQGLRLAGQSLTGGGGGQNPQEQAAAGANMAQAMGRLGGFSFGGGAEVNPNSGGGFFPGAPGGGMSGGFMGGPMQGGQGPSIQSAFGGFMGGQPPQQAQPQQPQQPMDANARFKLWRDQGIRA